MATKLGDAYVEIGSRLGLLTSGLARAKGMVTGAMGAIVQTVSRAMDAMKRAAGIGGLGLAGAIGLGVKKFADFEEAMAKVSTMLSHETMPLLAGMSRQIRGLSKEFALSSESLAAALFDVLSAGYAADKAMALVREGARLATAGFTGVDTAMSLLLTTMKSYNMQMGRAADVSDMLYGIMWAGRQDLQVLADNMGAVVGVAAKYGVSLSELGAVLASVITHSGRVAESFTQVRSLLMAMAAPTKQQVVYMEEYGIQLGSVRLATEGMIPAIRQLQTLTPEIMRGVLSSQEAVMAVQFSDLDFIARKLEGIRHSGGRVAEALVKAMGTVSFKLRRLKYQVVDALVSIGGFFSDLWNKASADLKAVGMVLWAAWAEPLQRIAGAAGAAAETVRNLLLRAWDAILKRLVTVDISVRKAVAIARAGLKDIGVGIEWLGETIKVTLSNALTLIKGFARMVLEALKPIGSGIAYMLVVGLQTLWDALEEATRKAGALAQPYIAGMRDAVGAMRASLVGVMPEFGWTKEGKYVSLGEAWAQEWKEAFKAIAEDWDQTKVKLQVLPAFPGGRLTEATRKELAKLVREAEQRLERLRAVRGVGVPGMGVAEVVQRMIDEIKRALGLLKMPQIAGKLAAAAAVAPSGLFAPRVPMGLERWGAAGDETTDLLRKIERNTRLRRGGGLLFVG